MNGPELNLDVAEDDALILRVQRGEVQAFASLIDRHLVHLRTFIALKAPVLCLVDELAHESFVFAFQNLHEFRPGSSFRAWLRTIAWNLLRAEMQRFSRQQVNQARFAEHQMESGVQGASGSIPSDEADFLEECVGELPEAMRELLHLKYREDCSTDEIAQRLRRTRAWVRTVLFRLRQQLKNCIEEKVGKARPC